MAGAAAALLVTVEPGMGIAGMVEHAVEDHAHSRPQGVVAQPEQRRVAAKLRIDAPIILGIVFMHAGGGENRVQIQSGYAELLQVGKFFADAVEIPAVERRPARLAGKRVVPRLAHNLPSRRVMVIDRILVGVTRGAAGKAIGENLIEHLIGHPLRAGVRQVNGELLQSGRRESGEALWRKPALMVGPQQLKAVAAARLAAGERDFAAPCHHAWLRRLAEPLHRQRQLFVILFRAQRDPLRQRLTA